VSEWLAERGILVDQSTIYRWVQRFLPLFGEAARRYRQPVDWRVDETYARIRGYPRWGATALLGDRRTSRTVSPNHRAYSRSRQHLF
jgi:transposase-like protein